MSGRSLRFGFRARLALLFFAIFVLAAAALLTLEYAVVAALFDDSLSSKIIAFPESGSFTPGSDIPQGAAPTIEVSVFEVAQAETRDDVLGGLLFWSIVTLAAFSVAGSALAWWMSGRPLRRISEVTVLAQCISEHDLGGRLDLGGPRDEIRRLADTFDNMLDRLQHAFEAQSTFIANASHELRTPLAINRTALEVTLRGSAVMPDARPALQRALRANQRSEALLDSLLTLAGAQRGGRNRGGAEEVVSGFRNPVGAARNGMGSDTGASQGHEDLASCVANDNGGDLRDGSDGSHGKVLATQKLRPLASLLHEEVCVYADLARSQMVTLICDLPNGLSASVPADMFTVICSNLVRNAVAYNHPGGSVWITAWRSGELVTVSVTNTGPPVTDSVDDLLKPFHRGGSTRLAAASSRNPGGTASTAYTSLSTVAVVAGASEKAGPGSGLGLAIADAGAVALGGRLRLTARPQGGLIADVEFPCARCAAPPQQSV